MTTKRERLALAKYEHMKLRCLEDMATGRLISEVVGSIKIIGELLYAGYAKVALEYSDERYQYRDVGITDAGRTYLAELQAAPKNYTVGPHGGVKLNKEG